MGVFQKLRSIKQPSFLPTHFFSFLEPIEDPHFDVHQKFAFCIFCIAPLWRWLGLRPNLRGQKPQILDSPHAQTSYFAHFLMIGAKLKKPQARTSRFCFLRIFFKKSLEAILKLPTRPIPDEGNIRK